MPGSFPALTGKRVINNVCLQEKLMCLFRKPRRMPDHRHPWLWSRWRWPQAAVMGRGKEEGVSLRLGPISARFLSCTEQMDESVLISFLSSCPLLSLPGYSAWVRGKGLKLL